MDKILKKPTPPCLNCEDRTMTCHDDCPKYLDFSEKQEAYRNAIYEAKTRASALDSQEVQRGERIKRRMK